MKASTRTNLMIFSMLISLTGLLDAQQQSFTKTIGFSTTSSTSYGPIYRSSNTSNFDFSRHSHLYLADELNLEPGSIITEVEWFKNNNKKTTQPGIFSIYMGNNSDTIMIPGTNWTTSILPQSTLVYSDSAQMVGDSIGWTRFDVDPFVYGGSSLQVSMAWDISGPAGNPSDGAFFWRFSNAPGLGIGKAGQSFSTVNILDFLNHGNNRPNIRITYLEPIKDDAGVTDIISPAEPVTLGGQNFEVVITNAGNVPLTAANVYGTITNTIDMITTDFGPVGISDTLSIGDFDTITLGSFNLQSGTYELTAWTSDPNNNPVDYDTSNDTLMTELSVEDDAGVSSIASPVLPLSAGLQPFNVVVTNFGNVTLSSANVYGKVVDIIAQTSVNFGPVPLTDTLLVGASDTVTIGTINLPGGTFEFVAWTADPNGNPIDFDNSNDTTMFSGCTQLTGGTYTINAGAPVSNTNFQSFNAAIDAMITCGGISGPVVFEVVQGSGPYAEQILFPEIVGASAANTITFNGNGETITHTTTCSFCSSQYLIRLNGVDHLTLNDLVITAGAASPAIYNIHLLNGNDSVTISNCTINNDLTSTSPNFGNIVLSGTNTSQFSPEPDGTPGLNVVNNTINGGYTGIFFNGPSSSNPNNTSQGLNILNNNIRANVYGIRVVGADAPVISQNDIDLQGKSTIGQGIYMDNVVGGFSVDRNKIINQGNAGIFMTQINDNATALGLVVNNMIGGGYTTTFASYGIYMSDVDMVGIIHNSVLVDGGSAANARGLFDVNTNTSSGLLIANNSFSNTAGGVAMELNNPGGIVLLNHNNYHTTGTNLVEYGQGVFYSDLGSFQADPSGPVGHDVASREGDPQYVSSTDLHFTGNQLDDGATASVGITIDFDGENRDASTPDIGADENAPPMPACQIPGNLGTTNITSTSVTLDWEVVSGAVGYIIKGRPVGVPITITLPLPSGSTSFFNVNNLVPGTSYEWQIRSVCSADGTDTSLFSALETFTTASCVAPDTALTTNVTATSARLNWVPVTGAVGYEINGQAIGGPLVMLTVSGGGASFFQVNNLPTGVTFQWSVKTICSVNGSVKSPFTNFSMFTTNGISSKQFVGGNLSGLDMLDLSVFPNPNEGNFQLTIKNVEQEGELFIYDMLGAIVSRHIIAKSPDQQRLDINLHQQEKGTYLIRMVMGEAQVIKRVVLQ